MTVNSVWKGLTPRVQFWLLMMTLPGVVIHEWIHAVAFRWAGVEEVYIDWSIAQTVAKGDASVLKLNRFRFAHVAPSIIGGVILLVVGMSASAGALDDLSLTEAVFLGVNLVVLTLPSPADVRGMISRRV